jgi:hypothetical protein
MALFDTDDGLIVTQEESSARARCGRLNFLFRNRTVDAVLREYQQSVATVRSRFGPRQQSSAGRISDGEFEDLTMEIALHWMYYYIINGFRVEVTESDLAHPQTTDIVWRFLCRKHGDDSPTVGEVAPILTSMTPEQFERWLVGWKNYLDR